MNTVNKPVDVVSTKDSAGIIKPVYFFLKNEEELQTFTIERLIRRDREKINGKNVTTFTCEIILNNMRSLCDLRLNEDNSWILLRI
jgi:hypothetical protein